MLSLKYGLLGGLLLLLFACSDPPLPKPVFELSKLELHTADGQSVQMSDWGDRVLVVNFWASWCAPCVHELPDLQSMAAQVDSDKYQLVLISVDASPEDSVKMLNDLNITLPAYVDPNMELANGVFELTGFPETLVIKPSGELHERILGAREWQKPEVWQKILP